MDRRVVLPAVLAAHLAAAALHGSTHALVPVGLPPWQDALVLVAVFLGPTLGVALVLTDRRFGVELFTVTMAAGLLLGVALHFVVENPDHVHAVTGPWRLPFRASAVAVAAVSAAGTVAGLRYWVGGRR